MLCTAAAADPWGKASGFLREEGTFCPGTSLANFGLSYEFADTLPWFCGILALLATPALEIAHIGNLGK